MFIQENNSFQLIDRNMVYLTTDNLIHALPKMGYDASIENGRLVLKPVKLTSVKLDSYLKEAMKIKCEQDALDFIEFCSPGIDLNTLPIFAKGRFTYVDNRSISPDHHVRNRVKNELKSLNVLEADSFLHFADERRGPTLISTGDPVIIEDDVEFLRALLQQDRLFSVSNVRHAPLRVYERLAKIDHIATESMKHSLVTSFFSSVTINSHLGLKADNTETKSILISADEERVLFKYGNRLFDRVGINAKDKDDKIREPRNHRHFRERGNTEFELVEVHPIDLSNYTELTSKYWPN